MLNLHLMSISAKPMWCWVNRLFRTNELQHSLAHCIDWFDSCPTIKYCRSRTEEDIDKSNNKNKNQANVNTQFMYVYFPFQQPKHNIKDERISITELNWIELCASIKLQSNFIYSVFSGCICPNIRCDFAMHCIGCPKVFALRPKSFAIHRFRLVAIAIDSDARRPSGMIFSTRGLDHVLENLRK